MIINNWNHFLENYFKYVGITGSLSNNIMWRRIVYLFYNSLFILGITLQYVEIDKINAIRSIVWTVYYLVLWYVLIMLRFKFKRQNDLLYHIYTYETSILDYKNKLYLPSQVLLF